MTITIDPDRASVNKADDRFGFVSIARKLAPSIIEASKGDGVVIGLEGKWGSGKTTLLNYLRSELVKSQGDGIHTISIAPWVNGDSLPLVSSLLEPMLTILKRCQEELKSTNQRDAQEKIKQLNELGRLLKEYGPKTARQFASAARFAGHVYPGAQVFGKILDEGAKAAEHAMSSRSTPSELKDEIAKLIQELNVSFVVVLDDLDRLEPQQAVEAVRLVRSVADFPKVAYVLCYDREILAQALETGLKVSDGSLFLQKIVQLSFSIPLPEPFDLRTQFLAEAKSIYNEVMEKDADNALIADLKLAVDREGYGLSTPREVKIALNGVRFVFPQVKDDVYFPDFCRLHLIKSTNFNLYQWLEAYLALRSVVVMNDGMVSTDEKEKMGRDLVAVLPSSDAFSSKSIWNLQRFIPGVSVNDKPEERVFRNQSASAVTEAMKMKRLGSPLHYRFYFALAGPKSVMPDSEFNSLLDFARTDFSALASRFSDLLKQRRPWGKTWFEHVLDRLDEQFVSTLEVKQLEGVLKALGSMMDIAIKESMRNSLLSPSLDQLADALARSCLKRLYELDPKRHEKTVLCIARDGLAINWLVGTVFRNQLFRHGVVGDDAVALDQREIPKAVLDQAVQILNCRASDQSTKDLLPDLPDLLAYLWGWSNLSSDDQAMDWVRDYSKSDEGFLNMLEELRGLSVSDKVTRPLSKEAVSRFFNWDAVLIRLEMLRDGEFGEKVRELEVAINQARR